MPNLKKDQILLARFSLLEMIGKGAMGQIWLVWDLELEIRVAIKILDPRLTSRPERIELLKNECRNTRRLVHPNIVRVFDFHRSENLAFISMEYIDGQDLTAYRSPLQRLSPADIQQTLKPVVNALGYAHGLGLVHRDVKASNILIDRQKIPRLTDFGIAGVFRSGHNALQITSGGSLFSMSPQQLDGRPPRPSDDIYSLGVLLYEMLTGYPPFYPDISRDKILHQTPPRVNQRLGQIAAGVRIPDPLEYLIAQMLAKMPDERPGSMQEIENRLDHLLEIGSAETRAPGVPDAGVAARTPATGEVKIITPVRVTRKAARKGLPFNAGRNLVKGLTLAFAAVFLVIGGLWLWHELAGRSTDQPQAQRPFNEQSQALPKTTAAQPAPESEKSPDPATLAADKEQAQQKLAEFMQLLAQGAAHEKEGNAALAHAEYQQALRLDPESQEAQQALARVNGLISDRQFQQLMSEGLAALDASNYKLAREKLLKAQAFKPASQEVKDALAQLDQSMRLASIETHRRQAAAAEQAENWQQALDAYLQVLIIDPNVQFASRGKQRALDHIRIDKRINFFLQQPAALESDPQLENALQLMAEIERIDPRGPRLQGQLAKLARLVDAARTPVKVMLESDGLTEVAVYKVGKLGRFVNRVLSLRPGTYTVVGTRDGYQDVRRQLTIRAGQSPASVAIICEVKI